MMERNAKKAVESAAVFSIGGTAYSAIEVLWRGRTHWTMALTGGACFLSLYRMSAQNAAAKRWLLCVKGSGVITALEFFIGCLVNRKLKWNVWDYSNVPLNILGQVCPLFSILWFFLCFPGVTVCRQIQKKWFLTQKTAKKF